MIEEFNCLRVQGEIVGVFVVEEMNGVHIQFQTECFQEQDIIAHDVLVGEIEFVDNNWIHVIVAQQIVQRRLIPDVLKQDVQRLQ